MLCITYIHLSYILNQSNHIMKKLPFVLGSSVSCAVVLHGLYQHPYNVWIPIPFQDSSVRFVLSCTIYIPRNTSSLCKRDRRIMVFFTFQGLWKEKIIL